MKKNLTNYMFERGSYDAGDFAGDNFREIGSFSGVVNTTPADVIIRPGSEYSIKAAGDRRGLRHYRIDIKDDRLRIRNPWRPWHLFTVIRDRDVRFEITAPELSLVTVAGSGDVHVEGLMLTDNITLRTTGSGDIAAEGDGEDLAISITGSGDISFSGSCNEADLSLNSSGKLDITLRAVKLGARITGAGDIAIKGSADELELRLTGSGKFEGSNFTSSSADITATGAGDAILTVEQSLKAKLSGSGDIRLVGGQPEIEEKSTGSGRVIR